MPACEALGARMSRYSDLVTKPAREMGGCEPGVATRPVAPEPRIIRLDSNENPFGPSPRAIHAMRRALAASRAYPDNDCTSLTTKLSDSHGIAMEQILVTAGSTGMLTLLCRTLLTPGLNAVTSEKSFIVYGVAVRATGAELIEIPARNDGFDLAAILAAINDHTRLVLLANPNNPTGTMLEADELDRFISEIPDHVVVVLDEAYYEFAAHFAKLRNVEYSRSLTNLRRGTSLVVLRTFSKAHGLAGLRVGYGLGPAELLSYCRCMQDTYAVSSIAQAAALAAFDDGDHIERSVSHNAAQAEHLRVGLSDLGFKVVPTWANFLYCDLGQEAAPISRRLREEGVSVRPLGAWGASSCIRVSIGTAQQNAKFLEAMRRIPLPIPSQED